MVNSLVDYAQAEDGRDERRKIELERAEWKKEVATAYRPILGGFLLPAAIYYAVIFVSHYVYQSPLDFVVLGPLSLTTSIACAIVYWRLQRHAPSFKYLEITGAAIYALVYANILVHHLLHLEVSKLIYFVLLTFALVTTGVSLRVVIPGSLISLATSIWLAGKAGPDVQFQFAFIAFASSFVAFGMAVLMRRAIQQEIRARLRADELRETAEYAAEHDALTGLPNRRRFFRKLEEAFARPREGSHLALGVVDLNGFKPVNDLYGHAFGDRLLISVGERIRALCDEDMQIARMGGDEFTILIEKPMSDQALKRLGSEICAAIGQSYNIVGSQIAISASLGFARRVATDVSPEQLYEHADYALYRAKENRHGGAEVFGTADAVALEDLKSVEHHLRNSDWSTEMYVEYQPQIDVASGKTIGFEALARWDNSVLGLVSPEIFIRAAERSGIIGDITPLLLRKALKDAVKWPTDLRLSFNLSARDVVAPASIAEICQIVLESGFAGSRIDFEITETSIMTDFDRVRQSLKSLQGIGAHIALDDFGVGYSNFEHIDELNINKLKIDRRFVSRLGTGGNTGKIVRTMIEMCSNLELGCIVEGVETEDELNAVMGTGARTIQGYCFSKPLSATEIPAFLSGTLPASQLLDRTRAEAARA